MLPIDPAPNGAGDTVTALFLANLLVGRGLEEALGLTASAIFAVMAATLEAGTRELQLVAAQDAFADPPRRFSVERVA
jgi:pyridoxine kinase